MAQTLRVLPALSGDVGLLPSTHIVAHNCHNSSFRRAIALFSPIRAPCTHVVHTDTYKQSQGKGNPGSCVNISTGNPNRNV